MKIDVRDYIVKNYTPYDGDDVFLQPPTVATKELFSKLEELMKEERARGGVYDIDTKTVATITSHAPGYIDKSLEKIVGVQTDEPLKRAIMPFGGIRPIAKALKAYNRELDPMVEENFKYRRTHNDGVYTAYTEEMRLARRSGIITGLPDAYGRGRIIGDYRRVALYGVDALIEQKTTARNELNPCTFDEETIRIREEMHDQIKALNDLKKMAGSYGIDISNPAEDTKEAIQWLYFAYLAAVKEQNGAAMSLGRVSTFLDTYAEKDLASGKYTESEIQEFIDHFVMKLRIVRFLRDPAYDALFSGDPTWVTEAIAGMCIDGRHMVTKMSYRFMHTLTNLGPAPEPNLTVLWDEQLPENFKKYCAYISIKTSSVQYENDRIMREKFGDDYGIACCVSAMRIGKQLQFFGARCNLTKALLYAINGGKDEKNGDQVGPNFEPILGDVLEYDEVMSKFNDVLEWMAQLYINSLNVIHYMHDKYCYETLEMALHDENILRTMACGMAGLSIVADSFSAIKYAKVYPIRNEDGLVVDYKIEGDFPKFGNNDPRVDDIAVWLSEEFIKKLEKHKTYRNAKVTSSILTITSNVVYGEKTGATPCGRKAGEPFAPGANPMNGRETNGCLAAMKSVSKLPYDCAEDGISYTFSIIPNALGAQADAQQNNLVELLDGFFGDDGHHMNVNVINREMLLDAMEHPENYPSLTIRVSGYAVNFIKLTPAQQRDVLSRTFYNVF